MHVDNLSGAALVTHKGCMDGSACSILYQIAGGKKENIFFSAPNHNKTDEVFSDLLDHWPGIIIMADLSVSFKVAKSVWNDNGILLFDHHKSSVPLKDFRWCEIEVENKRAGCKMFYEYLLKNSYVTVLHNLKKYKDLVDAVDDMDRWVKNLPESEMLAKFHEALGQKSFINRFLTDSRVSLTIPETYALNLEHHKRDSYIKQAKNNVTTIVKNIDGHDVNIGFVFAEKYQSTLGHAIYQDPKMNIDVVVMVRNQGISMRARPNCPVDLSEIAKLNGGGGHPGAAGCDLSSVLGKDLLDMVIERLKFS